MFICGAAGVGKSYILNRVLDESNSIEIYDEVLTKKDIYLDTIKNSNVYTYIENYETDMCTNAERTGKNSLFS